MRIKPRVFISGPYSLGDTVCHVKKAIEVGELVYKKGGIPFVPHLFHFWHFASHRPKEFWLELDMNMLHAMNAIVTIGYAVTEGMEIELNYNSAHLQLPVFSELTLRRIDFKFEPIEV